MQLALKKIYPLKQSAAPVLLFFLLFSLPLSAQLPAIRQINIRQGLPQSEVMCMLEDSRGYLWAGTRGGGLVRINGNELKVFNSGNGLKNNFINDLSECRNGKLLVTSAYGGLHMLHGKNSEPVPADKSIREYLKTIPLNDTLFYVLHPDGVALFHHKSGFRKSVFAFPSRISRIHNREMVGQRWLLISVDSGLFSIDTKSPARSVFLKNNSHLSGHRIAAIRVLNQHSAVLISSDGMAASLDFSDRWPLVEKWLRLQQFSLHPGEEVRHVVFGRDHTVRVLASNKNRILIPGVRDTDLSRLNGMKIPFFSGILKDRNDRLLISTLGSGILMVPEQSALSYSEHPLLANSRFSAVLRTSYNRILCGGMGTGLLVFNPEKKELQCLFPESDVLAIAETPQHYLIGTSAGFRRLRKTDFSEIDYFNGMGKVVSFCYLPDSRLLIGCSGKGLWMLDAGKKPYPLTPPDTDPAYAYSILPYTDQSNLIVSNTGIWRFRPGTEMLEKLQVPDSMQSAFFLGTRDVFGNYWFSGTDGLVCMRGRSWSRIGLRNGLSSALIYTLNADSSGNLWVGSSKGLDKITLDRSGRVLNISNIGPEEGFDGYETNMRGSFMGKNALYLCTIQGLFSVNTAEIHPDPPPPAPEISSIISSRNNLTDTLYSDGLLPGIRLPSKFEISRSADLLLVDFAAINPVYPSRIRFSFRLAGSDSSWSEPGKETRAGFALPSSGICRFEVRSTYNGIDFSQPATIEFRIASPWYFSWLILVPVLFILLVLYLLYHLFYRKKNGPASIFLQRDARWTESTGHQVILFLTAFYPLLPFLAARFDASVCIHPVQQLAVACLFATVFLFTIFSVAARSRMDSLLKGLFFLMVADSGIGVLHNHLSPFYTGLLLAVSTLSLIVFAEQVSVMLFGLFLNVFAYFCAEYLKAPHFPPSSFQLISAGMSIVLVLVALVRQSSEDKWLFASRVVNDGPVLVLAFNEEGNLVFASSNLYKLLGFHFDEIKDSRWKGYLPAEAGDLGQFEEFLRVRENREFRLRLKKSDSGFRTFRFTCTAINPRITILLGEDISEKEMLESRFENLVVNAGDSIFQTDLNGKILYANPQSSLLLGLGTEEIQGSNYHEFVPEEHRERVIEFFRNQLQQENSGASIEFPVITRNGFSRWMAFQTSVLKTPGASQPEGILAIGRDITERMEAEQLIRIQHKNISDSLTYASRIRSALQPAKSSLSSMFSEFALLDQPKDIIGGDFLWLGQNGTEPLLVLGDCTGHGVPGAFMTTISMGLLRERVENDEAQHLETLLGNFNRALNASFGRAARASDETFDFAELALISLDKAKAELLFVSSGIGLHRVRGGELLSFPEASKGLNYRLDYSGMEQRIPLEPQDVFYLFSDGLFDQIGGPNQKRFSKIRLKEAILASDRNNLAKGMQEIQAALAEWQGNCPQTDDRMMISFRV